jgi:hypothetical protein
MELLLVNRKFLLFNTLHVENIVLVARTEIILLRNRLPVVCQRRQTTLIHAKSGFRSQTVAINLGIVQYICK